MRTFDHNGVTYTWFGGFGAIFKSFERGVKRGDVRYICDRLFYAHVVYDTGWIWQRHEVCWVLTGPFDGDTIRAVQAAAFGMLLP